MLHNEYKDYPVDGKYDFVENPLHIEYDSRNIRLSNEGKLYADGIAATLFF